MMEHYDYVILTPTYQRPVELRSLIRHLAGEQQKQDLRICHIIVDDGSAEIQAYKAILKEFNSSAYTINYRRHATNYGRQGFWKTWQELIDGARPHDFAYCIALSDDLILAKNFLKRATNQFEFLRHQDEYCVAMNLLNLHPTNWGTPRYLDGAFIARRKLFDALDWSIFPIGRNRFRGSPTRRFRSSGVHKQITQRIHDGLWSIAPVCGVSYCRVRDGIPSQLFPPDVLYGRPCDDLSWNGSTFIDEVKDVERNGTSRH